MAESLTKESLYGPVHEQMRTDFIQLGPELTVAQALDQILEKQPTGRIIYFYVANAEGQLLGVVPTRRLLLSPRDQPLSRIMIEPVIAIPRNATVLDACEFFIFHKLLAFPVVDEQRRIVGQVDVELYTRELRDIDRRQSHDDLFQLLGVHSIEGQRQSVPAFFRRRFPWLLATLAGGVLAAAIADRFYDVASLALVVPFVPLVLALASGVASQSVSLAVQTLRIESASETRFWSKLPTELATGCFLGAACGIIAAVIVFFWKGSLNGALCLLAAITGSVACAAGLGLAMPALFRLFHRNPHVAAGPITLAAADAVALAVYFSLAGSLLL
ncbi:MAG: magnesium transporter [Planctomycetaceae bacterium]|nr:magnesium transporter [Planctomycetaceae bacterium]